MCPMPAGERYDKIYSQTENETTFNKGRPESVVAEIVKHKTSGKALELGAGEGRNSLFLAEKGFTVTAKDLSQVGIDKIKKLAAERGLNIQAEVADIRTLGSEDNFDVYVCTYVLHHLKRDEALSLIKQMQEHTNAGGLNALTTFTENGDFYRVDSEAGDFYPAPDELKSLYDGWEILDYEEVENQALQKKEDGTHMMNVTAKILARKPAN